LDHGAAGAETFAQDVPLLFQSDAHSTLELHFNATNLVFGGDTFTLCDPFLRIFPVNSVTGNSLAKTLNIPDQRTEVIKNTKNPSWFTGIKIAYHFEEVQYMRIEVRRQEAQR